MALFAAMPADPQTETETETENETPGGAFEVLFDARIVPSERVAHVRIELGSGAQHVGSFDFNIDPERHEDFEGDGTITVDGGRVRWEPPSGGGALTYRFRINHLRNERSYDARCTATWALFRGGDLVPAADVRVATGSRSRSHLRLRLPEGWSAATRFDRAADGTWRIENPRRIFDRPTGWIVVGDLGVLREEISGMQVAIAGPVKQRMRRHDILALLRWTSKPLKRVLGQLPDRLLVVGAGDPMWRGGLSGPDSLYLHNDRPLISEDGTSPPLHEIMHSMLGTRTGPGGGWIVEGLAELYSIEMLRRSDTISKSRYEAILERHARRARREEREGKRAAAFGVTFLAGLDRELREQSRGRTSLDEVTRALANERPELTPDVFARIATRTTQIDVAALMPTPLPKRASRKPRTVAAPPTSTPPEPAARATGGSANGGSADGAATGAAGG